MYNYKTDTKTMNCGIKKSLEIISWLNIILNIGNISFMVTLTSKSPIVNRVAANESDGGISGLYTCLGS